MHFWTYLTCNYVLLTCKMKQVNKRHLLCFPYIWCKLCTHHNECLHQRSWDISILAYLSHTMIKATLSIKIALSLSLSFKVPKSCQELASCSGITTDGEYWIYPTATNGRRTKIYCHNLALHYVTLKYPNRFIQHDKSNWINELECPSDFKGPLKSFDFSKVRIQIEVIHFFSKRIYLH